MDRRITGDETWRRLFDERGLSNGFEFNGRDWDSYHGNKAYVKCKACGLSFLTWGVAEVFRGRKDRLICIRCGAASSGDTVFARTTAADNAMLFYQQGHSVKETAEKFGITTSQVNNLAKARGISNNRDGLNLLHERSKRQHQEALEKLKIVLPFLGFDYLGGYTNKKSTIRIRCRVCGTELERTYKPIVQGTIQCKECRKREKQKSKDLRESEKIQKEAQKANREETKRIKNREKYETVREAFLNKTGVCKVCGKTYTIREYVNSCGLKYARDSGICSKECRIINTTELKRKSHKGRKDSNRHRAKKYGTEYDSSVTLKKLIARDGLICALCGGMCDLNDHSWTKFSGPLYPNIDHIVPMSKGGAHAWDNVQVAHIMCNSLKSDKVAQEGGAV